MQSLSKEIFLGSKHEVVVQCSATQLKHTLLNCSKWPMSVMNGFMIGLQYSLPTDPDFVACGSSGAFCQCHIII